MAIIRTQGDWDFKNYGPNRDEHRLNPEEWKGDNRADLEEWKARYTFEADNISEIITENGYIKVLELGSGPGVLSQLILERNPNLEYTCVDKEYAKKAFDQRSYSGRFVVKQMMNEFDVSDLDDDYDLIIANDFLEHIANPSDVVYKTTLITKKLASFYVSVPNWRMGHDFIYRGLFDYDNFVYFMQSHGWSAESVQQSPLQCAYHPKLSSEETMPDELVQSWNWYFHTKKIKQ
jgi:2-polyprenyl-3-methyl-5-hydroxy-6-metoxy-1,4-benzoquinol methylase